ncbi:hypothetical protein BLA29_007272, partial [Euroglyphus maynei]
MAEELNENLITTMKATCDRLIIQVRVAPDYHGDPNRSAIYHVIMEKFSSLPNVERKLLVKIAKASDLRLENDLGAIYCMIEMDEPYQSERTTIIRNQLDSPEWDQHFMFNVNEKSQELLFELLKESTNTKQRNNSDQILGNTIVNIKELISNPSQSKTLRLQSAMDKQDVGNLFVE